MTSHLLTVVLCAALPLVALAAEIQCRDDDNNPVDWYVVYKLPPVKGSSAGKTVKKGAAYMYMSSSSVSQGWTLSSRDIGRNDTLLANTIVFLYHQPNQSLWMTYNDQGDKKCGTCGHTKGILGGDEGGGLWLVHSVPHLPVMSSASHSLRKRTSSSSYYPATGYRNGQSALCISLSAEQLDSIGLLFQYNQPKFQGGNLPVNLSSVYSTLFAVFNGKRITQQPWNVKKSLTTKNNQQLLAFAKSKRFGKDLYGWVAEEMQTDLDAETWLNEGGALPSACNASYRVMNIDSIKYDQKNISFSTHKDHSKWAITESISQPWVCIGDINRATPQEKRGGGTVCVRSPQLWKAYHSLINETQPCQRRRKPKPKILQTPL